MVSTLPISDPSLWNEGPLSSPSSEAVHDLMWSPGKKDTVHKPNIFGRHLLHRPREEVSREMSDRMGSDQSSDFEKAR